MSGDPHDILRLKRCPECDYDLGGLPVAHNCPECGFEYDENIFDLQVWLAGSTASRRFDSLAWSVLVVAIGWTLVTWRTWFLSQLTPVLIAGSVGLMLAGLLARFFSKWRKRGNAKVLCTADGLSSCLGSRRRFYRWSKLNLPHVRRTVGGGWRFRLAYRWPRRFFAVGVRFIICGTNREVALLRREFRRQIALAR